VQIDVADFSTGRTDQMDIHTLAGIVRQGATHPKRLVIGMGKYG
jgi:hypothetical protein